MDVAINPRTVTAEEMVRFAHDPRIRQLAMLEGDRFEVLDMTVRPDSEFIRTPFKELPHDGLADRCDRPGRWRDLPAR